MNRYWSTLIRFAGASRDGGAAAESKGSSTVRQSHTALESGAAASSAVSSWLSFILVFALLSAPLASGFAYQNPQRERRATAPPISTPERAVTATPTPISTPAPAQSPQPSPSPTASRTAARATPTKTLPELQTRIAEILRKPELSAATVGIIVTSLDTGRVVFEENANKLLRPASNMKLYTVATALDALTPDFRFVTSVYATAKPGPDGVIHGDLTIYGRGDPSIAARFNNGDYFKGINDLADLIAAAGVKLIDGDLVGDESHLNGAPLGSGWEWEDLQWWFGAQVSALSINDNAIDLTVKPGEKVGAPCVITTGPPVTFMTIANRSTTSARGSKSELQIYRGLGANTLEIRGSLPLGDDGFSGSVAIPDPARAFIFMLRDALSKHGITVKGQARTVDARSGGGLFSNSAAEPVRNMAPPMPFVVAGLQSPPLSVIAANTLKPSQNLYTELILRTLGATSNPTRENETAGLEVVKNFLKQAGIAEEELTLNDGSGLSRNDMVTASATARLLTFMSRHRYSSAFREALPLAGVDGTLRNRFRGTVAENNLRAKTGSLASAASLSGYLTTAAGERFVFSIMVNNYPPAAEPRQACIDPIAVLLASFAGHS